MIEINLLPQELRKKESPFAKIDFSALSLKNIPIAGVAIGVVGLVVAVQLFVSAMSLYYNVTLGSLNRRYGAIAEKKKEADALKLRTAIINKKSGAIDELMLKRFSWAKKLNALSDSMTPGIWLVELNYDEQSVDRSAAAMRPGQGKGPGPAGALVISGYAAGAGEQGAALVGKFIKNLKESEVFFSDFNQIELVSIKADRVQNQEVMNFRISCFFK